MARGLFALRRTVLFEPRVRSLRAVCFRQARRRALPASRAGPRLLDPCRARATGFRWMRVVRLSRRRTAGVRGGVRRPFVANRARARAADVGGVLADASSERALDGARADASPHARPGTRPKTARARGRARSCRRVLARDARVASTRGRHARGARAPSRRARATGSRRTGSPQVAARAPSSIPRASRLTLEQQAGGVRQRPLSNAFGLAAGENPPLRAAQVATELRICLENSLEGAGPGLPRPGAW
jgi:hypothetical protein